MTDINFMLPIPTLWSLSVAKAVASMWKLSLDEYHLPPLYEENRHSRLKIMVDEIQVEHRQAIQQFISVPHHAKSQLHDMDIQMASEVLVFLEYTPASEFVEILLPKIEFGMRGDVSYEASYRAALPFISDPETRFEIVVKIGLMDLLDDAWYGLTHSTIKHYLDVFEKRSDMMSWYFLEIYFVLFKMNRLRLLEEACASDTRFTGSLTKKLFWEAHTYASLGIAKYSFALLSARDRHSVFVDLVLRLNSYDIKHRKEETKLNRKLSIYTECLADFSRCGLIDTIFASVNCVKLITPLVYSCRYLYLASSMIGKLEDTLTVQNYMDILQVFLLIDFKDCQMRKSLLLEVLDRFNKKFKSSVLSHGDGHTLLGLCENYGHDVAVKLLRGGDDADLRKWRLEFCRLKLQTGSVASRYYIYNKFMDDVVPVESREEFIRLLQLG